MLGLVAGADQKQYIAIIPKDISKYVIILAIKSVMLPKLSKRQQEKLLATTLTKEAQQALEQINQNKYILELTQRGLTNIRELAETAINNRVSF